MSYTFDTLESIWSKEIRPYVADQNVAMFFEIALKGIHEANHRVGDELNHDANLRAQVERLKRYIAERKEISGADWICDLYKALGEAQHKSDAVVVSEVKKILNNAGVKVR